MDNALGDLEGTQFFFQHIIDFESYIFPSKQVV